MVNDGGSWKSLCKTEPNSKEILVHIILYMDRINIDKQGIFNTALHSLLKALETLYFHLTAGDYLSQGGKNQTRNNKFNGTREATLANIHAGHVEALKTLKKLCDSPFPIKWHKLPYAGKTWFK